MAVEGIEKLALAQVPQADRRVGRGGEEVVARLEEWGWWEGGEWVVVVVVVVGYSLLPTNCN